VAEPVTVRLYSFPYSGSFIFVTPMELGANTHSAIRHITIATTLVVFDIPIPPYYIATGGI